MAYSIVALKEKIMEMHPEIARQQFGLGLHFDEEKNAYSVTISRGTKSLTTYLGQKDADECMNGIQCVYLGLQVAQFIKNYGRRERFDLQAA